MKKGLRLLKVVAIYVICEIGLSVLQGVLATQLYHNVNIDYELMQKIIMFGCACLQNSIRMLMISFVILVWSCCKSFILMIEFIWRPT